MQTECPHCHTVFQTEENTLSQADGQVRCGHCLAIFTVDNPYHSVNYNAFEDAEKPTDTELQFDEPVNDSSAVADVIPPELRAESRRGKNHFGFIGQLFLSLAIITCIAAGMLQYAYYNRHTLVKIEALRPWMEQACTLANCDLPAPKDTRLIVLNSKNIFTHPNVESALMISASMVNTADFEQAFPVIELRFENVRGQTIAGRRFSAEEYLGIPRDQITKMLPDTPVNFNLEIKDPGNDMVSYEFAFL